VAASAVTVLIAAPAASRRMRASMIACDVAGRAASSVAASASSRSRRAIVSRSLVRSG
jgi:hypothetical protein